jgi:hypothetical protein
MGRMLARGLVRIAAYRIREGAGTLNILFGKTKFHVSDGVYLLTAGMKLGI